MPPPPPTDAAQLPQDMKYYSASETETDQKPDEPLQETIDRAVFRGGGSELAKWCSKR